MKVDLAEIVFQEEIIKVGSKNNATLNNASENKIKISNLNGLQCEAALVPEYASSTQYSKEKSLNKEAATVIKDVDTQIGYRIYVFDKQTGNIVDSASYIRNFESFTPAMKLIGNKTYTIIAYSNNVRNNIPPPLSDKANINTANIINKNEVDFMFQKQDIHIDSKSTNLLKIKFKHQFSQIETTIRLSDASANHTYIRGVSNASIMRPSFNRTRFDVIDEKITGLQANTNGVKVNFPFIEFDDETKKSITATSNINVPSEVNNGTLLLESLTIGNITRGNILFENIKFIPGMKYKLILTFTVPPTLLLDNPYFEYRDDSGTQNEESSGIEVTLEKPTFGAQLDIYYLDNSFQLYINEQPVFSRELNFEDELVSDVQFSDGSWYSGRPGGGAVIYFINQEKAKIPVVRLVIDQNGNIQLFGRKSMTESLRQLTFRTDIPNPVTWNAANFNKDGTNKLRFSSTTWTNTYVYGRIFGLRTQ